MIRDAKLRQWQNKLLKLIVQNDKTLGTAIEAQQVRVAKRTRKITEELESVIMDMDRFRQ